MATGTPSGGYYLAECYHPDVTTAPLAEVMADLLAACVARSASRPPVHLLLAVAAPTDDVLYTVFAARSAEAVIATCADAGHPVERITSGVEPLIAGAADVLP